MIILIIMITRLSYSNGNSIYDNSIYNITLTIRYMIIEMIIIAIYDYTMYIYIYICVLCYNIWLPPALAAAARPQWAFSLTAVLAVVDIV